jgi:hypothetical protein
MASSFTEFKGKGFWSDDSQIEAWLALLTEEIGLLESPPEWLNELKREWVLQATLHGGGFVSAALDEFATSEDRIRQILELSESALQRLAMAPASITVAIQAHDGEVDEIWSSHDKRWIQCIGEEFVALLEGRVSTTAATSPKIIPRELRDADDA